MTDLPSSDDELLSSLLDGELTAEDRARLDTRLRQEPALRARLDALREAASLAATPVRPLPPEQGDALIAAALAASTTTPAVRDLAAARHARMRRWFPRVAVGAAALAVLAIAAPALLDTGDETDLATGAGDADTVLEETQSADTATLDVDDAGLDAMAEASGPTDADFSTADDDTGDGAADDGGGDDGEGAEAENATLDTYRRALDAAFGVDPLAGPFGPFGDDEALVLDVRRRMDELATELERTTDGASVSALGEDPVAREGLLDAAGIGACAGAVDVALDALGRVVVTTAVANTTVAGAARVVVVSAFEDAGMLAVIVDPADCSVIDSVELNPGG